MKETKADLLEYSIEGMHDTPNNEREIFWALGKHSTKGFVYFNLSNLHNNPVS